MAMYYTGKEIGTCTSETRTCMSNEIYDDRNMDIQCFIKIRTSIKVNLTGSIFLEVCNYDTFIIYIEHVTKQDKHVLRKRGQLLIEM